MALTDEELNVMLDKFAKYEEQIPMNKLQYSELKWLLLEIMGNLLKVTEHMGLERAELKYDFGCSWSSNKVTLHDKEPLQGKE